MQFAKLRLYHAKINDTYFKRTFQMTLKALLVRNTQCC